jgi:HSPB1-associated protein 1
VGKNEHSAATFLPVLSQVQSTNLHLFFPIRKRWHLFPPEDTPFLYPTRIPYEESSVFSKINVVNPDLNHFPQFQKAQRHTVTLNPGQVMEL